MQSVIGRRAKKSVRLIAETGLRWVEGWWGNRMGNARKVQGGSSAPDVAFSAFRDPVPIPPMKISYRRNCHLLSEAI